MILMISLIFSALYFFRSEKINTSASIFLMVFPFVSYLELKHLFKITMLESEVFVPLCVLAFASGAAGIWNIHKKTPIGGHLSVVIWFLALASLQEAPYILLAGFIPLLMEELKIIIKRGAINPNSLSIGLLLVSIWALSKGGPVSIENLSGLSIAVGILLLLTTNLNYLFIAFSLFLFAINEETVYSLTGSVLFYFLVLIYSIWKCNILPAQLWQKIYSIDFIKKYKTFWALTNNGHAPLCFAHIDQKEGAYKRRRYTKEDQECFNFSIFGLIFSMFLILLVVLAGGGLV